MNYCIFDGQTSVCPIDRINYCDEDYSRLMISQYVMSNAQLGHLKNFAQSLQCSGESVFVTRISL
jgi:hypothetical protein